MIVLITLDLAKFVVVVIGRSDSSHQEFTGSNRTIRKFAILNAKGTWDIQPPFIFLNENLSLMLIGAFVPT
jgi:hypothetical protein